MQGDVGRFSSEIRAIMIVMVDTIAVRGVLNCVVS